MYAVRVLFITFSTSLPLTFNARASTLSINYESPSTSQAASLLASDNDHSKPEWQIHMHSRPDATSTENRQGLYRLGGALRWYLLAIILYMLAILGISGYVLACPSSSPGYRVLPAWNVEVNQFSSGLVLSAVLTPAAIVIRQISHDYALLHPFAVAASKPVSVSDLDRLMDPGLLSTLCLFKYAPWVGIIQASLTIAGVALVPVGTLAIFTGTYSAPLNGTGVVGMPTTVNNTMTLGIETGSDDGVLLTENNFFLNTSMSVFLGSIIGATGVLPQTPARIGPSQTANVTYRDTTRYHGIVTYTWASNCQYCDEIVFTEVQNSSNTADMLFNVTFPNGQRIIQQLNFGGEIWISRLPVDYVDGPVSRPNPTTYYIVVGEDVLKTNIEEAERAGAIARFPNGWIARVACTPTLEWHTSECTWNATAGTMMDCVDQPGSNSTELDTPSLDDLEEHMSLIVLGIHWMDPYVYGMSALQTALQFYPNQSIASYRVPLLADFDNLYGLVARAIGSLSTSGYYGAATVPTVGQAPRPAYLVREYIVGIVLALLAVPAILCIATLLHARFRGRIPFRPATFLTVAAGTRSPWWDATLNGDGATPHQQLLERHGTNAVKFGVDQDSAHIGFLPRARLVTLIGPNHSAE